MYGGSWNHSKVKDYSVLHNTAPEGEEPVHPAGSEGDIEGTWQWNITKGLAIRMSSIGVPRITNDNIEMVYLRCRMVDEVLGCVLVRYNDEDEGPLSIDYHLTMADIARRVGLSATTDKNLSDAGFKKRIADEIEHKVKRATSTERRVYLARQLILTLTAGDEWTPECDRAANAIGLDPDNYRANPTAVDNWPEHMLGKVTFDTGQSILDHYDSTKKVKA
jgi:hypothetical protein